MHSTKNKETSQSYWENYYMKNREPGKPSKFAEFVSSFLVPGKKMLELGCGNAKDSHYFASLGVSILAIDQCAVEVEYLNDTFSNVNNLKFAAEDMTNLPPLEENDYLYSRFTIHAIDKEGEHNLTKWAFNNLKKNGLFFIEVRSVKDELFGQGEALADNAYYTDHYRRFITLEDFKARLEAVGFSILFSKESNGFAPYKDADPIVIRVIAQKQ